jgi:hypothetical protein
MFDHSYFLSLTKVCAKQLGTKKTRGKIISRVMESKALALGECYQAPKLKLWTPKSRLNLGLPKMKARQFIFWIFFLLEQVCNLFLLEQVCNLLLHYPYRKTFRTGLQTPSSTKMVALAPISIILVGAIL